MKLTNEQKKRLIIDGFIDGVIFVVSAIVLKKTYDHGFKNGHIQGHDKGFNDALHIPHEAYRHSGRYPWSMNLSREESAND